MKIFSWSFSPAPLRPDIGRLRHSGRLGRVGALKLRPHEPDDMSLAAWSVPRRGFSGVAPSWNSRRSFCRALYTVVYRMCVAGSVPRETFNPEPPPYGSCTSSGGLSLLEQIARNTSGGSCTCLACPNCEETLHAEPVWRPHSAAGIGLYIPNQGGQI